MAINYSRIYLDGEIPKYEKISLAIAKNTGAAVSEPHGEAVGSRRVTNITNRGLSTGANPIKDAIVFSVS